MSTLTQMFVYMKTSYNGDVLRMAEGQRGAQRSSSDSSNCHNPGSIYESPRPAACLDTPHLCTPGPTGKTFYYVFIMFCTAFDYVSSSSLSLTFGSRDLAVYFLFPQPGATGKTITSN